MRSIIVPAIIAKEQSQIDSMLDKVKGKVERIMVDVMDDQFVPNTSLDFDFKLPTGFEYEAHLMVRNPLDWVRENGDKVDIVIIHIELLYFSSVGISHAYCYSGRSCSCPDR